jgi:hypothetical protein
VQVKAFEHDQIIENPPDVLEIERHAAGLNAARNPAHAW